MQQMLKKIFPVLLVCILLCGCVAASASAGEGETEPTIAFTQAAEPESTEPEDNVVHVSDVDSLLEAIAPDTEIVLEPGFYNLTEACGYGRTGGSYYHWESVFDGYELVITDLSGLTIRAEEPMSVTIATEPRYANVLCFDQVTDLTLSQIIVGHTKEKGSCSGGVLLMQNSKRIDLRQVMLYGCGTRGVDLRGCSDVSMVESDIFECSEGCVYIEGSSRVRFEYSKFYNCRLWNGVFEIYTSQDIGILNSEVYNNSGVYPEYGSLISASGTGIYLGGLDVHDNQFDSVFNVVDHPVTVESCRIQNPGSWYRELAPVSPEGKELNSGDLASMSMRTVRWELPAVSEPVKVEPGQDGKVHVTNVDEFLAAIARDTTIYLEPGVYDLSAASNYGALGGEFYRWERTYDGMELVISGVTGLTIEGASKDTASILATPRYANVLRIENSANLILRNFTAGHTQEPGECAGGVIQLNWVTNANIEGCGFFGCGILGVWGMDCRYLNITGTEIYECSSGAAWFYNCSDVNMDYCSFHDNRGEELYADFYCSNIRVNGVLYQ